MVAVLGLALLALGAPADDDAERARRSTYTRCLRHCDLLTRDRQDDAPLEQCVEKECGELMPARGQPQPDQQREASVWPHGDTLTAGREALIWAYGDSLTAGLHSCPAGAPLERCSFSPYAPALQDELRSRGHVVRVKERGYSGWTSVELFTKPSGSAEQPDLAALLRGEHTTLAVLLAGSNDLGRRKAASAEDIARDVWRLHTVAHKHRVPTVLVAIPPTGFGMGVRNQQEYEAARLDVNGRLRERCAAADAWCTFTDRGLHAGGGEVSEFVRRNPL